jgi:sterol 14-demethylase
MDLARGAVCCAIAIIAIMAVVTKFARSRPMYTRRPPPIVNGIAILKLLPKLFTTDLPAIMYDLHEKYGSVFTISLFGPKVTVLIGPEVLTHFFQGPELQISRGNTFDFTVPMFGQGVLYGTDAATRNEQIRFFIEALKPSKLRSHVDPMLQEVEVHPMLNLQLGIFRIIKFCIFSLPAEMNNLFISCFILKSARTNMEHREWLLFFFFQFYMRSCEQ